MNDEEDTAQCAQVETTVASTSRAKWGQLYDIIRDVLFGCRIYLSDAEEKVALFVFQRTRMYGKEWEKIPLRHFTEGVWSQRGGAICSRLVLKTSTVMEAIRHLKGKGLIQVREHPTRAFSYRVAAPNELNHHAILVYIREKQPAQFSALLHQLRRNENRLPEPFRMLLESADESAEPIFKSASRSGRGDLPPETRNVVASGIRPIQRVPNPRQTGAKLRTNVAAAAATGSDLLGGEDDEVLRDVVLNLDPILEVSEWQERRRDNRRNVNLYSRWSEAWRTAMKQYRQLEVGDIPPSTFRKLRIALERNSLPSQGVPEFLDWVVKEWHNLRRNVFSFNPRRHWGPETPDLGLVVVLLVHLQAEYKKQHWLKPPKWGPPERQIRKLHRSVTSPGESTPRKWAADEPD